MDNLSKMDLEIKPVENDTEENRMLNKHFKSPIFQGFVEIGKDKFILPNYFNEETANAIKNFQVRDDHIFVCCHLKTGSSWLQEAIWLINNNFDYEKLQQLIPYQRFCHFDMMAASKPIESATTYLGSQRIKVSMDRVQQHQSEDNFKTHLHWSLLPEQIKNGTKKPKIFVTLRNPYDVCISYYHYSRLALGYKGNFDDFCQLFLAGRVIGGPYWKHVLSYWEQRHRDNIMFVQYREMKENFPAVVNRVADFLGKTVTNEEVVKLTEFLSLENMQKNVALNRENEFAGYRANLGLVVERTPFIRVGKEGAYKTIMSPEMIKKFDAWIEENIAGTELSF